MIDSFLSNLQDGIYHVIHINAYDHILFFTVLVLPYVFKDWKRILFLTGIFIIGHCVTLTLVTYNIISVNTNLISFFIPLTIIVVALFNIFTAGKKIHHTKIGLLFFTTFFFGLAHGIGFSNEFNTLISESENKLLAILEIALGIEIGQLVVAFMVVFFSFLCQTIFRFSKRDWVMIISSIILGCVLPMLIHNNLFS